MKKKKIKVLKNKRNVTNFEYNFNKIPYHTREFFGRLN